MEFLPSEILLKILGSCTYFDLAYRLPLVCRRFYEHINSKSIAIDRVLFRDVPLPPTESQAYDAHIAFRSMRYHSMGLPVEWALLPRPRVEGESAGYIILAHTLVSEENAVSPAVTELVVYIMRAERVVGSFLITGGNRVRAVTVLQVIEGIRRLSVQLPSHEEMARYRWGGEVEAKVIDGQLNLFVYISLRDNPF